jgi:hypothetical protein
MFTLADNQRTRREDGAMRARDMKKYQVYPSPLVVPVISEGTQAFNRALEAWSRAIELATADNAAAFSRPEWDVLAELAPRLGITPALPNPGQALADSVLDHQRATGAPARTLGDNWRDTVARLGQLDYTHAWAVLYAVQHFHRVGWREGQEPPEWWTIQYRRDTYQPRGK